MKLKKQRNFENFGEKEVNLEDSRMVLSGKLSFGPKIKAKSLEKFYVQLLRGAGPVLLLQNMKVTIEIFLMEMVEHPADNILIK